MTDTTKDPENEEVQNLTGENADAAKAELEGMMPNRLIEIAMADSRLCRLAADLLDGMESDKAVSRNFATDHTINELPDTVSITTDDVTKEKVIGLYNSLMRGELDDLSVQLLANAVNHDSIVAEAENTGYIRGKNERIDSMKVPRRKEMNSSETDIAAASAIGIPRYSRRSFWDDL